MNATLKVTREKETWSTPMMVLHGLTALIIVGLAAAGFVMTDLRGDSALRLLLSRSHTIFGATLMLLTVARLIVRFRSTKPAALPLPTLHRRGVAAVHALLYISIFALGASGFITGARSAWPDYLGGALASSPQLEQLWSRQAHEVLVFSLLTLVVLHVGGVLIQELRAGGTLKRMIPLFGPKARGRGSIDAEGTSAR
ncbi:MAG: cytochrome b/b6 domain-containing protein [Deltaproteobacteria bacterium]|nr:cytochrome b/b6 domain-containing protein [Deltaproteobacteria bacterium]